MSEAQQYEDESPQSDAFVERPVGEVQTVGLKRITLQLNDEGRIDWERTADKAKEAFGSVVANDPEALEMIGLAAQTSEQDGNVTPKDAALLLNTEASIEQVIMLKVLKLHPQIAAEAFAYTDEDHQLLDEPLANVMNKYSSQWMKDHKEIATLVFGLFMVKKRQITRALISQRAYLIQVREREGQSQPINGVEQPPQ